MKENELKNKTGRIISIRGPVLDIEFPKGNLPHIYNALIIKRSSQQMTGFREIVVAEVQQSIGNNQVRAVAMSATTGLKRDMEVFDTGGPIEIPVGKETLGRVFNVLGEPIDKKGELKTLMKLPIHRPAPSL
ncbi:MAG TPA: F0F1 ATP synthase subunit beta, partial [Actinobacteria bacterium]|nr:F0F1 ATP synthase subunit beta [Actinomycetota bacterium]